MAGELQVTKLPNRKGMYLVVADGASVRPVARFCDALGLDAFWKWVDDNEGNVLTRESSE